MIESSLSYSGDFHSPTLAFGDGYACIAFMMHMYGTPTPDQYWYAQNSWIIGTYNDKDLFTCELQSKFSDTESLSDKLTGIYPKDTDHEEIIVSSTKISNNTNHDVNLYGEDDSLDGCTMSLEKGLLVPVINGNLAAYGTRTAAIDSNSITIEMLQKYQPYCILEYDDSRYMCVYSKNNEQMMSVQRKNYIYESTLVTKCIDTDDVRHICYIPANSSINLSDDIKKIVIK
ncbi:hypothetical protein [Anaerostipes faecalis]|uniref:hypothetical protein n=1 Tax=Anaerostipes faecalis TaxID=2738446 RepID=UPI003F12125F